jgi:hypothetical protein
MTSARAYAPFPPVMNAYYVYSMAGLKSITLCGTNEKDRLYCIEVHTGWSTKRPLGFMRPGVHIHNGPTMKDPVLVAAGDLSMDAAKIYHFSLESIVLLPPLNEATDEDMGNMVTETMSASTVPGDKDAIAFRFEIEVEDVDGGKRLREGFEWRSVKKQDKDPHAVEGGFKLLRLDRDHQRAHAAPPSSPQAVVQEGIENNVVAVLAWAKMTAIKHAFSLQLLGHGLSGALGERWTLMVVATAARLWTLHGTGRATRTGTKIGEKMRSK